MPSADSMRTQKLIAVAKDRFGNLGNGEMAILRGENQESENSSVGLPIVGSDFFRWLVTDPDTQPLLPSSGVAVRRAFFSSLDLSRCNVSAPLYFANCFFEEAVNFNYATITNVMFDDGTQLSAGISGFGAHVKTFVILQNCKCDGSLSFPLATIEGRFACKNVSLNSGATAVDLSGAIVTGDVLVSKCRSESLLKMASMSVSGIIQMTGTSINTTGTALTLNGSWVKRDVLLDSVSSNRTLDISNMEVGGIVTLSKSDLSSDDCTVHLESTRIGGDLILNGVRSGGTIRALNARISGSLWSYDAVFHTSKDALDLDYAAIEKGVFLSPGFQAEGSVSATGVQVGSDFDLSGARLGGIHRGIDLERAVIKGSLIADSLQSSGSIYMPEAKLGGDLHLSGAQIGSPGTSDTGVRIDSAEIGGNAYLRSGSCGDTFRAHNVLAIQSTIKADFDCSGGEIHVLDFSGTEVGGRWIWTGISDAKNSELFLQGAKINQIHDDQPSWPMTGKLHLYDLTYNDLITHAPLTCDFTKRHEMEPSLPLNPDRRVEWLRLQPPREQLYSQPWSQLAGLLVAKGNADGARHVTYEYQCSQANAGWAIWRPERKFLSLLEEEPIYSLGAIGALWFVGFLVFWRYKRMMVPSDPNAYEKFKAGQLPPHYVHFHPAVYSLENVLPVIRLGQDSAWRVDPEARRSMRRLKRRRRLYQKFVTSGHGHLWYFWLTRFPFGFVHFLRKSVPRSMWMVTGWAKSTWVKCKAFFSLLPPQSEPRTTGQATKEMRYFSLSLVRWLLIILGWILALVFAAAVTRYFK